MSEHHDAQNESGNPYRPRKLQVRDPLHDLQLLRDLAIINERTQRELGPLPASGLPVEPKRKPKPHRVDAMDNSNVEDEAMKFSHAAAAATFGVASMLAACGSDSTSQEPNSASTEPRLQPEQAGESVIEAAGLPAADTAKAIADAAQHGTLVDNLDEFVTEGTSILMSQTGDLNSDGRADAIIVVSPPRIGNEKLGEGPSRIVMLLVRDSNGRLRKERQNTAIVPCEMCGGLAGDPFGYVRVEADSFTIATSGGSRERWWNEYTFSYSPRTAGWLLVKVERGVSDLASDESRSEALESADLGEISFENFDPSLLPDMRLP